MFGSGGPVIANSNAVPRFSDSFSLLRLRVFQHAAGAFRVVGGGEPGSGSLLCQAWITYVFGYDLGVFHFAKFLWLRCP